MDFNYALSIREVLGRQLKNIILNKRYKVLGAERNVMTTVSTKTLRYSRMSDYFSFQILVHVGKKLTDVVREVNGHVKKYRKNIKSFKYNFL